MSDKKEPFDELFEGIKQIRDELKVQIHLGKAEAKEEWEKLENKLEELKVQTKPFADAAEETAKGVGSAMVLAADELKTGYDRIKKLLK